LICLDALRIFTKNGINEPIPQMMWNCVLGCPRKLGSMVWDLLINGVYWGYNPLANLFLTSGCLSKNSTNNCNDITTSTKNTKVCSAKFVMIAGWPLKMGKRHQNRFPRMLRDLVSKISFWEEPTKRWYLGKECHDTSPFRRMWFRR